MLVVCSHRNLGKYKLGPDVMPVLVQAAPLGGGEGGGAVCAVPRSSHSSGLKELLQDKSGS